MIVKRMETRDIEFVDLMASQRPPNISLNFPACLKPNPIQMKSHLGLVKKTLGPFLCAIRVSRGLEGFGLSRGALEEGSYLKGSRLGSTVF